MRGHAAVLTENALGLGIECNKLGRNPLALWRATLRMGIQTRAASNDKEARAAVSAERAGELTSSGGMSLELRNGPLVRQTETELVQKSAQGDHAAYAELIARHEYVLRAAARKLCRTDEDADDLAQESFIRAYHSIRTLQDPAKFGVWLRTILRHTALDLMRGRHKDASLEALVEGGFDPAADCGSGVPVETYEEQARVLSALNELRADYRQVIVLKHVHELSYKQIASRLNMSVTAVGEKLSRVRSLLRRKLEKKSIAVPRPGAGEDRP